MRVSIARGIQTLGSLPAGSLFLYKGDVALKSEYRNDSGYPECFIVDSGEMFYGGAKSAEELNCLMVTPILLQND